MSPLDILQRFLSALIDAALCWGVLWLILPFKHYYGEPLYVRFRGLVLLALLVGVLSMYWTLGTMLTCILGVVTFVVLVGHCLLLHERSEYPDR